MIVYTDGELSLLAWGTDRSYLSLICSAGEFVICDDLTKIPKIIKALEKVVEGERVMKQSTKMPLIMLTGVESGPLIRTRTGSQTDAVLRDYFRRKQEVGLSGFGGIFYLIDSFEDNENIVTFRFREIRRV